MFFYLSLLKLMHSLDFPSIHDNPSLLGISSIFRTPSAKSGSLNARSAWSMSSTDGPNTACTGSTNSAYARVQAVPAVQ